MTTKISMAYGSRSISLNIPSNADLYRIEDPVGKVAPKEFARRLDHFLDESALDLSQPAVVVADKTRLCGYPQYLPVLLETLQTHGTAAEAITLFIAYGTHGRQNDQASLAAYGPSFQKYRWIHHRCEGDHFVQVGKTRRGTPVRIRTDIAKASCVITFGAVSHHYFAGFGGGRKLLFPGLGEKEAVYANHGLFLDRARHRLSAGCRAGQLEGNPLAEDLADYASYCPVDLAIHGILDNQGRVCDLLVGKGEPHFRTACDQHAAHCEVSVQRQYDLVLASCGGFPKDINFIQSHKAIHHSADFVRDGGCLIVLAECRDGVGSQTFLPWFEAGDWKAAFDRLADHYTGNGGTALSMMAKLNRINIKLVTELSYEMAQLIGFEMISAEQVQGDLDGHHGTLAVIPNAGMVYR